jgi:nitrous oxidase accessory protein
MERRKSFRGEITCIILWLLCLQPSSAKILIVSQNSSLNSIRKALDLAHSFDTIQVSAGVYREGNIIIQKPVILQGIGKPVLDGEFKYEILSVWSSNVQIEGFDLRNSGKSSLKDLGGIKCYNSRNIRILNNTFSEMFFAIYFQECTNSYVLGNTISSSGKEELQTGNGIHCWKCDSMQIRNNNVTGHRDGIYFEFVTNSFISWNQSNRNVRYGLHFMFSHHNDYEHNTFANNGAGVAVMYTHHVTMRNNVFKDNWGSAAYGLLLKEITDSRVEENIFSNNSSGIYMEGSNRIMIEKNNFKSNGCALRIQASCDNNEIRRNNFTSNTFDVTTNGTLVLNTFINNYWDRYEGYDLDRNGIGDIPYHPVSVYSMIIERIPVAVILIRSFMVALLEKTEKAIPGITPENFRDDSPMFKPVL